MLLLKSKGITPIRFRVVIGSVGSSWLFSHEVFLGVFTILWIRGTGLIWVKRH